jgi:hypothetical protein
MLWPIVVTTSYPSNEFCCDDVIDCFTKTAASLYYNGNVVLDLPFQTITPSVAKSLLERFSKCPRNRIVRNPCLEPRSSLRKTLLKTQSRFLAVHIAQL